MPPKKSTKRSKKSKSKPKNESSSLSTQDNSLFTSSGADHSTNRLTEQQQPTNTPQQQHQLVNASNAYPPEGKEEQEIQLLHKLRYLAFESDFNGTSQELIASLHTRWRNSRVSESTYSKLIAEESAQAYLSLLIEAACQGYLFRIEKQALMIPASGNQSIWYDSSLAVLMCLYRNIYHFDPASVVKVFNAIAERSKDFPDKMTALFARFQPEFDQFKDCYSHDEVCKVQLRGYLTAVSHGIIDWLPGGFEKVGSQVEMIKNGFDQFEVPIKPTITTTVVGEWQQFAPTTSTLLGQEAVKSSCEPDSSPSTSQIQTNTSGSKTLANADINIFEPGDEVELRDSEASIDNSEREFIEDLVDVVYEGIFGFNPILDEQFEDEPGVLRVVRKACEKVAGLVPDELMDPTDHMVRAAGRIVRYLRKHIPMLKYDSYLREQVEDDVYLSIDGVFDRAIMYAVEREGSLVLFTQDDPPYAASKEVLTNFVEHKPRYMRTSSGLLSVTGKGNLTLLDDMGDLTQVEAHYSPNIFTEAEKRQTSATISHSCLSRAGYTLEYESTIYGCMRYTNHTTGGTFWVFRTRNNRFCMPYDMSPIVTPLMKTVCGLRESPIGEYILDNVMSFESYADDSWDGDDNDSWDGDDNDSWGSDDNDESLNDSRELSNISESDDFGSEDESSDDDESGNETGVSKGFFNKVQGLFAF
ncbi:hypothetical protein DIURU_003790 [Diutina rugosa]|uniref:Uncharacterized protein n=1 Tax=Diutina rugosa TaxID=5481 RepID=A0A642UJL7_DIURU|nr:uncharacterized protein DIURU_003790 [Diutina rugosa]KAA8900367.1 hypothetical protein DIURU_003790 [Diutina rugosa]